MPISFISTNTTTTKINPSNYTFVKENAEHNNTMNAKTQTKHTHIEITNVYLSTPIGKLLGKANLLLTLIVINFAPVSFSTNTKSVL